MSKTAHFVYPTGLARWRPGGDAAAGLGAALSRAAALLDALTRRSYGRYLLRGERPERLRYEVGMRLDHRLPAGGVHHICSMSENENHRLENCTKSRSDAS